MKCKVHNKTKVYPITNAIYSIIGSHSQRQPVIVPNTSPYYSVHPLRTFPECLWLEKLTNKGTWHSKTAKFSISGLWDRPSPEGAECTFLAFSSKDSVRALIPSHIREAKSQNLRMRRDHQHHMA